MSIFRPNLSRKRRIPICTGDTASPRKRRTDYSEYYF